MTETDEQYDSNDESEDELDEDPKVMLLAEAGLVPGLDDNLDHLLRKNRRKEKKRKKKLKQLQKRRRQSEGEIRRPKKYKREVLEADYVIDKIITYLNKPSKYEAYQNCLMMSEWLVTVPDDFEENWIMTPCPPGKRMLIVAASGTTRCFTKSGDFMFFFQSALPGGHLVARDESSKSLTILDCIWHHRNKTYYVLDVLSWNNSHMLNCEAKFRFFWIEQKLMELDFNESESNHYQFAFLPRINCGKDEVVNAMTHSYFKNEIKENVDGFLFYDAHAPYFSGISSSVGWIKPFMVPDVFNVEESCDLVADRPDDYVNVEQYIKEFEDKKKEILKEERKLRQIRQGFKKKSTVNSECVREDTKNDVVMEVEVEETVSEEVEVEDIKKCMEISESENFIHSNNHVHS